MQTNSFSSALAGIGKSLQRLAPCGVGAALLLAAAARAADASGSAARSPLAWPALTRQARPWAYWWWMGSAVDTNNLTRELQRYHDAGLGGVHIIPIYGAKGFEKQFIDYLSPKWMEMMGYSVQEARRLDMGVDMTTGTGWCFGGPLVSDSEANASVVVQTFNVEPGAAFSEKLNRASTQTLMAFSAAGQHVDLTGRIDALGQVNWRAENGPWSVYAISQKPSGQQVKRASPGGQGHMLNLFYAPAMTNYLAWFDRAFAAYHGPKPRAMYHDSYEYRSDWAPDLFASFESRRGYRLQDELPALFAGHSGAAHAPAAYADPDRIARVRADYRETLSDQMAEVTLPLWTQWSHAHGFITRNEAHGSPGNWLDLYAASDIPETEMFYRDRNKLVSKFASSAAHVAGKPLTSSETGTWLKEHFTETLADVKYLFDDMFLSGINHMFYHGTCYSPDEAGWPGWHFYASLEMNPRNAIWHDAEAVNQYAARCQSILQAGRPDNDLLLYWPLHDFWQNTNESPRSALAPGLTVHARDWFEGQPMGKTAEQLWNRGYSFDYLSDRQLLTCKADGASIHVPGGSYRVVLVPPSRLMPLESLRHLIELAKAGATIVFQDHLPSDVPGWGRLEQRRTEFRKLLALLAEDKPGTPVRLGKGRVVVGELEASLAAVGVARETLFDHPGLMCIRRLLPEGRAYFLANRSEQASVSDPLTLATRTRSVVLMDPLTGTTGVADSRATASNTTEIRLRLQPGESIILRCFDKQTVKGPRWTNWDAAGGPVLLSGNWRLEFIEGGPELPPALETQLGSWTGLESTNAQRFAGTARYRLTFDAPGDAAVAWRLDLGKVCQSARVRLNGQPLGTLIIPPFSVTLSGLKPKNNLLEVEVTSVSANRIRDLDRRGVSWKTFYDINIVGLDYRPFNAANWPLTDAGLLGPVTLTPVKPAPPGS